MDAFYSTNNRDGDMHVCNHAGYEKMKHGILCLILLLHETENSMCHLLHFAVMLYSELPPAGIWANKLCCHLKQRCELLLFVVFCHKCN
jgi:hypothetical protein